MRRLVGAVAALGLWACSSSQPGPDASVPLPGADAGADAGAVAEAGPDASAPAPVAAFTPEQALADGEVGLRGGTSLLTGDLVRLEVVLGRFENVYGLAAVLGFEPQSLKFERFESGGWLEGEAGVVVAKVAGDRLSLVVTRKGAVPGERIAEPRAVGALVFKRLLPGTSSLSFVRERSTVRTDTLELASKALAFRGGSLVMP